MLPLPVGRCMLHAVHGAPLMLIGASERFALILAEGGTLHAAPLLLAYYGTVDQ